MPKLILRCNYLKNAHASHLENYIRYLGMREGAEKVADTSKNLPATARQKALIQDILSSIDGTGRMHEYYDYVHKPTKENASEFITQALENNLDIIAKKKNYIDYLANRPRVERIGTHGLFSYEGEPVVLSKVAEEVANHKGVIWTNVISLRREDAQRLGYDSAVQWQALLRSRAALLAENYKIDSASLKWYAAFHNESHHPHVHLVIYSTNTKEGYLTKQGIENMRSVFAHDIFRQNFMNIYERKNAQRNLLKEQAQNLLQELIVQMQNGTYHNEQIAERMQQLSKRLQNIKGRKVYGYLKADVKKMVDDVVDLLASEPAVAEGYRKWQECQNEVYLTYKDTMPEYPPLSAQKEFKSIKNRVIFEAVRLGNDFFYSDDDGLEQTEPMEEKVTDDAEGTYEETADSDIQPYAYWTDAYKKARGYLYGTEDSEPDLAAAHQAMQEEADNGNAFAMYDVGRMYQQEIYVKADSQTADAWYQKAFQALCTVERRNTNPRRQAYLEYRIGKMYLYGHGVAEDAAKAATWFERAAEKHHQYARYSLAMLYLSGKGVERDEVQARHLFMLSHTQGNPYASYELAKMYANGTGAEQDAELAQDYYHMALTGFLNMAQKGRDDNLLYRIGTMYLYGKGTEPDETDAVRYFEKAAAYGNAQARYQLAKIYLKQQEEKMQAGQPTDAIIIEHAIIWMSDFAQKGNSYAAYRLGRMYLSDGLVQKDVEKAAEYLEQAAQDGNQYAQYMLGKLLLIGKEIARDEEKGKQYLEMAAAQGNIYAVFLLEHWQKNTSPDMLLISTRLLHQLGNMFAQQVSERQGRRGMTDRKLRRKLREKKIAQGHAEDDGMQEYQGM